MKFTTLIALVAVAQAQEEAAAPLEAGADCAAEGATCAEGLCCGDATKAESAEGAADGINKVVCNTSDAKTWEDAADSGEVLEFACKAAAEEGGATKLAATAALLSAAYLLA